MGRTILVPDGSGPVAAGAFGDAFVLRYAGVPAWLTWPTRHGEVFARATFGPARPVGLRRVPSQLGHDRRAAGAAVRGLLAPGRWVVGEPRPVAATVLRPEPDLAVTVDWAYGPVLVASRDGLDADRVAAYAARIAAGARPVVSVLTYPDRPVRWGFVLDGHHALAAYRRAGEPPIVVEYGPLLPDGDTVTDREFQRAVARQPSIAVSAMLNRPPRQRPGHLVTIRGGTGPVWVDGTAPTHVLRYDGAPAAIVGPGDRFTVRHAVGLAAAPPSELAPVDEWLTASGFVPDRRTGYVAPGADLGPLPALLADGEYEIRVEREPALEVVPLAPGAPATLPNQPSLVAASGWPPPEHAVRRARRLIDGGGHPAVLVHAGEPPAGPGGYLLAGHAAYAAYLAAGRSPLVVHVARFGGTRLAEADVPAALPDEQRDVFVAGLVFGGQRPMRRDDYDTFFAGRGLGIGLLRYEWWIERLLLRLAGRADDAALAAVWRHVGRGEYDRADEALLAVLAALPIGLSDDEIHLVREVLGRPDPRIDALPRRAFDDPLDSQRIGRDWILDRYRFAAPDRPAPLDERIVAAVSAHPKARRLVRAWRRPYESWGVRPEGWVYVAEVDVDAEIAADRYAVVGDRRWPLEVVGATRTEYHDKALRYGVPLWPERAAGTGRYRSLLDGVRLVTVPGGAVVCVDRAPAWLTWSTMFCDVFVRASHQPAGPDVPPDLPVRLAARWDATCPEIADEQTVPAYTVSRPERLAATVVRPTTGAPVLLRRDRAERRWVLVAEEAGADAVARSRGTIRAGERPVVVAVATSAEHLRWGVVVAGQAALAAYLELGMEPWVSLAEPDEEARGELWEVAPHALDGQPLAERALESVEFDPYRWRYPPGVLARGGGDAIGLRTDGRGVSTLVLDGRDVLTATELRGNLYGWRAGRLAAEGRPAGLRTPAGWLADPGLMRGSGDGVMLGVPDPELLAPLLRLLADGTYEITAFVGDLRPSVRGLDIGERDEAYNSEVILATDAWPPPEAATIAAYRERIEAGGRPAVVLLAPEAPVNDAVPEVFYLLDGHHRLAAYAEAGVAPLIVCVAPFHGAPPGRAEYYDGFGLADLTDDVPPG